MPVIFGSRWITLVKTLTESNFEPKRNKGIEAKGEGSQSA